MFLLLNQSFDQKLYSYVNIMYSSVQLATVFLGGNNMRIWYSIEKIFFVMATFIFLILIFSILILFIQKSDVKQKF